MDLDISVIVDLLQLLEMAKIEVSGVEGKGPGNGVVYTALVKTQKLLLQSIH